MKTVSYSRNSPYADTQVSSFFLDQWTPRAIPKRADDALYEIDQAYQYRPDLLAYDLYGDAGLWWVFAVRNPNIIEDPIFDFVAGSLIYVSRRETIKTALGT